MKLTITGRNIEITRAHRTYIRKRFEKWNTFLNSVTMVHVILSVEGYRHTAEVTSKDKHYSINAKTTTKDMYQSIDLLAEKITHQLTKQHDKLINKDAASRSREKRSLTTSAGGPREAAHPSLIVDYFTGKPMSIEEALLQLQNSRKPFLVFEDAENGQLAVLSKEKNNKIKLTIKE